MCDEHDTRDYAIGARLFVAWPDTAPRDEQAD